MANLRQVFVGVIASSTATGSVYTGPTWSTYDWDAVPTANDAVPWAVPGTFQNAAITLTAGPGAGKTLTYTLVKNGVDTALTFTIADLATTGSSSATVTVVAGDLLYWRRTASATVAAAFTNASVEFVSTGPATSAYAAFHISISNAVVNRMPLLAPETNSTATMGTNLHEVVAVGGTITAIQYRLAAAPGASKSFQFVLYKNGVKQDGTGGTVETRVTIADSATTDVWTGTLAVAAGDWLALETTPTNTPATGATLSYSVQFVAATASQSIVGGLNGGPIPGSTRYAPLHSESAWNTTEAEATLVLGPAVSPIVLRDLYVRYGAAGTQAATFALRQNGVDTALAVTVGAGSSSGSNLAQTVTAHPGDALSMHYIPAGAPGSIVVSFSLALVAEGAVELVAVPNVVGMTEAAADTTLVAVGLITGTVTSAFDPLVAAGLVISQTPTAGSSVALGSDVDVVVSLGPAPDYTWQITDLTDADRWMTGLVVFAEGEAVALPPPPPGQPTASPTQVVIPMHVTTRVVLPSGVDAWGADCLCDE